MCVFTLSNLKKQFHKVLGNLMFRNVALKIVSYSQICRNDSMKIKIKWHVGSGSLMDF